MEVLNRALSFGHLCNPFGSSLESDNWNKKSLEFGAHSGVGAAPHGPQQGLRKSSVCAADPRKRRARLPGKWLRVFPLFCSGPLNAETWMHTEIKAVHCVPKDFFFFLFGFCFVRI